jgi:hypothetical protein
MVGSVLESLADLLRLSVQALELVAVWLEDRVGVAWPIVVALCFPPLAFALHVAVWWLRGTVWPLRCRYTTTKNQPCKLLVYGEWHRCRIHGEPWVRRTDRHLVDPTRPRWRDIGTRGGLGVIRERTSVAGLLYYQGYAKRPSEVVRLIPESMRANAQRLGELGRQLRQWRPFVGRGQDKSRPGLSVSSVVPEVIDATRVDLLLVVNGLLGVALAIKLRGQIGTPVGYRVTAEYLASFFFLWAYTIFKHGIWGIRVTTGLRESTAGWGWRAWAEAAGSFGALMLVAWAFGMVDQSWRTLVGYGEATAEAIPGIVVLVAALLFVSSGRTRRRRVRRR